MGEEDAKDCRQRLPARLLPQIGLQYCSGWSFLAPFDRNESNTGAHRLTECAEEKGAKESRRQSSWRHQYLFSLSGGVCSWEDAIGRIGQKSVVSHPASVRRCLTQIVTCWNHLCLQRLFATTSKPSCSSPAFNSSALAKWLGYGKITQRFQTLAHFVTAFGKKPSGWLWTCQRRISVFNFSLQRNRTSWARATWSWNHLPASCVLHPGFVQRSVMCRLSICSWTHWAGSTAKKDSKHKQSDNYAVLLSVMKQKCKTSLWRTTVSLTFNNK